MKRMTVEPIQTSLFKIGDELNEFIRVHLENRLSENCVVAITSKIVSLAEGCLVKQSEISKRDLVKREADVYLGEGGYEIELTIKHGILIPSAGIDESNSEFGDYILFPKNPYESAERIGKMLRSVFGIQNLGVIITDSHTMPLRRGVTGISLSHWGVSATKSLVGAPDLFGRELKFTSIDVVDSLAAMAVFVMGEADDRCPIAVIENVQVPFTESSGPHEIAIPLDEDLYGPLFKPLVQS